MSGTGATGGSGRPPLVDEETLLERLISRIEAVFHAPKTSEHFLTTEMQDNLSLDAEGHVLSPSDSEWSAARALRVLQQQMDEHEERGLLIRVASLWRLGKDLSSDFLRLNLFHMLDLEEVQGLCLATQAMLKTRVERCQENVDNPQPATVWQSASSTSEAQDLHFAQQRLADAIREAAHVEESLRNGHLHTLLRSIADSSVHLTHSNVEHDLRRVESSLDFQFRQILALCKARREELARLREEKAQEVQRQMQQKRDAAAAQAVEQQKIQNEIQREWQQWRQKELSYFLRIVFLVVAAVVLSKSGVLDPFSFLGSPDGTPPPPQR